jgi:maleylacetoacetate isomerase
VKLYSYWRSSSAYRVRIVLNLKGIAHDLVPVDLTADAQHARAYTAMNPGHTVPTLVTDTGQAITQSLAAIDYLDATVPAPPMLPADPAQRARVLSAALVIAADVQPVNNLRVLQYLKTQMGQSHEATVAWMHDWMRRGFDAFDAQTDPAAPFAFGSAPGLADVCLVAQLYNAQRWGLDLAPWPRLRQIETLCLALPAFDAARPENQPDAAKA